MSDINLTEDLQKAQDERKASIETALKAELRAREAEKKMNESPPPPTDKKESWRWKGVLWRIIITAAILLVLILLYQSAPTPPARSSSMEDFLVNKSEQLLEISRRPASAREETTVPVYLVDEKTATDKERHVFRMFSGQTNWRENAVLKKMPDGRMAYEVPKLAPKGEVWADASVQIAALRQRFHGRTFGINNGKTAGTYAEIYTDGTVNVTIKENLVEAVVSDKPVPPNTPRLVPLFEQDGLVFYGFEGGKYPDWLFEETPEGIHGPIPGLKTAKSAGTCLIAISECSAEEVDRISKLGGSTSK